MLAVEPLSVSEQPLIVSVDSRAGTTYLTVALPDSIFPEVQQFLEAGSALVRHVGIQAKIRRAKNRVLDPAYLDEVRKQKECWDEQVVKMYDRLRKKGTDSRSAIHQMKHHFGSTCYVLQLTLKEMGRLDSRFRPKD